MNRGCLLSLVGQSAVVIGGTSGIGKAIALGFAGAGANVIASSRSEESTAAVAAEIRAIGSRTINITSDAGNRVSLQRLCDVALEAFGAVDVLVNCAGKTRRIPSLDITEELWNDIFDTNLTGTLRACQIFGKAMMERRKGRIINIASLSSFVAFQEVAPYGASKAAVAALTRSLAVEWAPHGVLVNAIAPGIFPTALNSALLDSPRGAELLQRTPMGRFGNASELVSTALYLASEATSYTTGQIIVVDGGMLSSGVNQ